MSPDVRIYKKRKLQVPEKPTPKRQKRSHRKSEQSPSCRQRLYGLASEAGLSCYGRENLSAYIRYIPGPATRHKKRPTARRIKCKFCKRDRVMHQCLACKEWFCMAPPQAIPGSGITFPPNGVFCWHRIHGYKKWTELKT